jgi:hypothetical protein
VIDDIIASGALPVVCLPEVFRQAAASRTIVNARGVNHGEMPELAASPDSPSDFYFVEIESPEEGLAKIIQIVAERTPQRFGLDAVRDVQGRARLRHHRAQGTGLRVPRRRHPGDDAALPDAAAEPDLHRNHAGTETGGARGAEEGARDGRARRARGAAAPCG